jgi:multiple sugar transport system permease protein
MHHRQERWQLALLLLPYCVGLAVLLILPFILALPLAFTEYRGFGAARWIGLANFRQFARDPVFVPSVKATLIIAALAAPVRGLVALGLALLLRTPYRGQALLRHTAFLPTVMPEVAYALLWLYIFNPVWGPLNWVLPLRGFRTDAWLLEPGPAKLAIALMLCWTVGEGIVLLLAARRDIPSELYEAAAIDGATPGRMFTSITFPLLLPFQLLLLCRDVIISINASFVAALIITRGGPYYATTFLPYWIYLNTTDFGQFGYAAALNLILFGLTIGVMLIPLVLGRRWWHLADL